MTIMRRVCCYCSTPHPMGMVCACGSTCCYPYGKSDKWHCLSCGNFFEVPPDAPETHGMCPIAEEKAHREAGLAPVKPITASEYVIALVVLIVCGSGFGIAARYGWDRFASVLLFFTTAIVVVMAVGFVGWLFRRGWKLISRKESK